MSYKLKSCPRCNGDLMIDKDEYGWYETCLMCGYLHDLELLAVAGRPVEDREKEESRVAA